MSRTLPRVRELKQLAVEELEQASARRTLPRVRELKQTPRDVWHGLLPVAPFPGCVN